MSTISRTFRLPAVLLLVLVLGATSALATPSASRPGRSALPGLSRLLAAFDAAGTATGIARFDDVPTAADVAALQGLGLVVQPMRHLPLALVRGPVSSLVRVVGAGIATDVYPDERLEYHDRASADAMMAARVRAKGLTGKGVTIGIVDSGCDATHPDLADHVVHNVKLVSGEYANLRPDSANTIVVPFELLPYNNSDVGSGHGTHVAGIAAADGTTDPEHIGVAPDAELVCMSIGEVIATTAVVTAYDFLLDQPDMWGVDVINNSWGNSYRQFDPRDPVHTATKSVADLGVFVAFSAGNAGSENGEMSLNPFSLAPWVSSVASMDLENHRSDFSSNGLTHDNSLPVGIGRGGHTVFTGPRVGVYHPDFTTPGSSISSSCDTIGVAVGPCPPGENTEASGTSMASPHVAGAAAVLLQANPRLTPEQIRQTLQATARPLLGFETKARAPFWQAGYGKVDLAAAVTLVRRKDFARAIRGAQAAADRRVLASDRYVVNRSDFWTYDAPPVALAGSDTREFKVTVPRGTHALKISVGHPSGQSLAANFMEWPVEVLDASGRSLGTTTEAFWSGTGTAFLDLRELKPAFGEFTIVASGDLAAADPDTIDSESILGRMVIVHVAQLV
ncbi:MAG: S8 family serine peptidase [Actinobacteria bacterium]|nr:S8 family serine peptidase [Actinomycetota bacterium]